MDCFWLVKILNIKTNDAATARGYIILDLSKSLKIFVNPLLVIGEDTSKFSKYPSGILKPVDFLPNDVLF